EPPGACFLDGFAPESEQLLVGDDPLVRVFIGRRVVVSAEPDEPLLGRRPMTLTVGLVVLALVVEPVGIDQAGRGVVLVVGQGLEESVPLVHGSSSFSGPR